jgi:hypothetical protein
MSKKSFEAIFNNDLENAIVVSIGDVLLVEDDYEDEYNEILIVDYVPNTADDEFNELFKFEKLTGQDSGKCFWKPVSTLEEFNLIRHIKD